MEEAHHTLPFVQESLLFLAAAVIVVLLLHRIRVSPVLGYLLAGLLIGPSGLKLVGQVEEVRAVAELGVVFLLFVIGLELSVERLKALKRWVFGLGTAQVLVTSTAIGLVAWGWGNSVEVAVVLGSCLALSSTAVVIQLLVERGEVASPTGRLSFAVLLFQDLAVVPILVLVSILASPGDQPIPVVVGLSLLKAAVAVVAILVIGRYTLGPLLRRVAATRSTDLFTACALMIVLGTGWATNLGGLSAALGAFLAGLVLAGTEFRHQVESDIQPFKGLLLGLFFLAVGMGIDVGLIVHQLGLVVLSVVGLILLKALIAAGLAVAFGAPRDVAIRSGLLLGEGGEFAFVVIGTALASGLLPQETAQFMFAVVGLSIVATPFLPALADAVVKRAVPPRPELPVGAEPIDQDGLSGHVIIAGFGRVGQTVAKLFTEQQVPYVAVDLGPDLVRRMREQDLPVHYGDGSRPEILKQLGADRAVAVVVTLDTPSAAGRTVDTIRHHWPDLRIFARSRDREHAAALLAQGCIAVVPETFESSLSLAKGALEALGVPTAAVDELVIKHRETDATAQ
ncbi:monovalent cation:proton antiporter-2 (CPA2) family protein [Indioceanicola profundi]|uniref:monovalent cation:proton antiporter-2 (CPA2) family protein n=1 Tax=Indioceanicola profundi TaxID=2220096 RepID=UPI000E6ABD5A|nr:monovalent cation:proton antiporter-2 (CPA2) family protein [Indioceanicola profundi]